MKKLSTLSLFVAGAIALSACGEKAEIQSPEINQKITVIEKNTQPVMSKTLEYKEGIHYRLAKNINVNIEKPFIVEYFWLGCGHCQKMEPHLQSYLSQNKNVKIIKRHAALQDRWGLDGRIFYALENMGLKEHLNDLFALYIKKGEEKSLPDKNDLTVFLESKGINADEFFELADSDKVLEQIKTGIKEMHENKITGVPMLVVNGKYIVTPNTDIKNYQDYMKLISFLLNKE